MRGRADVVVHFAGDGCDLRVALSFADEHEVDRSLFDFAEVDGNNVLSFTVPDTLDNSVQELFRANIFHN